MIDALERFHDYFAAPMELLSLIAEIDEFKGRWSALKVLSPDRLTSLRQVATIESVGSSTRIEGVKLSDLEVAAVLADLKTGSFRSRDEAEVAGYAAAMALIFESADAINPTENHIKQIHSVLLQHVPKDAPHRGKYKTLPNNVAAFDADGREIGVVFETATPFDTPRLMERLVVWFNESDGKLHPLIRTAVFIVCFLAIHPFQDGNGRVSRVLTTLLMLRAGYAYVPYSSLESVIEENKEAYYIALRRTQSTLRGSSSDWNPWLIFFAKCLRRQIDNLSRKIDREGLIAQELSPLAETIVGLIREHGRLGISDVERLTSANRNTIKVRLRELVAAGLLEKSGRARASLYSLKT